MSLAAQMKHRDREMVPRVLVRAMFALMGGALLLTALAVLSDRPLEGTLSESPVAAERLVVLAGSREGDARVLDTGGAVLARASDDRMGFVGVIWRSLERKRMLAGADMAAPVRLVRREDGHVTILDPETGWSVPLIGYGADNVAAFARLLEG